MHTHLLMWCIDVYTTYSIKISDKYFWDFVYNAFSQNDSFLPWELFDWFYYVLPYYIHMLWFYLFIYFFVFANRYQLFKMNDSYGNSVTKFNVTSKQVLLKKTGVHTHMVKHFSSIIYPSVSSFGRKYRYFSRRFIINSSF